MDEVGNQCHHQNFFKKLLVLDEPFRTEEDVKVSNTDTVSKLLKILAAGNAEKMRSRLE
jgi:hypothetical protein